MQSELSATLISEYPKKGYAGNNATLDQISKILDDCEMEINEVKFKTKIDKIEMWVEVSMTYNENSIEISDEDQAREYIDNRLKLTDFDYRSILITGADYLQDWRSGIASSIGRGRK